MKVPAIVVVALLAGGLGATVGVSRYEDHQLAVKLAPIIKGASIRVANITEASTGKTYAEAFSGLEGDIKEIDKSLIDVQMAAHASQKSRIEPVLAYLKSCQSLLRASLTGLRGHFDFDLAIKRSKGAGVNVMTQSLAEAQESMKIVDGAVDAARKSLADIRSSRKALLDVVSADALIDVAALDGIENQLPKPDQAAPR